MTEPCNEVYRKPFVTIFALHFVTLCYKTRVTKISIDNELVIKNVTL
jgi:hypothetical protein